jgi:hypothetical protein
MADAPGGLKRELKRAVLAMARQHVLDANAKRQEEALYAQFYGNANNGTESLAQTMLDGTGVWAGLYDELLLINSIDPDSESRTKQLIVKPILWPATKGGKQFIVGQGGLTFDGVFLKTKADATPEENADPKYFSAKTLQGEAQLVVNTVRTATEIATSRFLTNDGEYPPGKSFKDMLLFVRQQCYVAFLGSMNEERLDYRRAKLVSPIMPEQMPFNYYFTGLIAFCLFGPKPLSGKYVSIFNPGVESVLGQPVTPVIRAENKGRSTGGATPKKSKLKLLQNRGLGVKDLVQTAQLEQIRTTNRHKIITDLMQASNADVQGLIAQKKTLVDQMQAYGQIPALKSRCTELTDKLDALDEEIDTQRKRGREWLEELDDDRRHAPKRAYEKCMKSIGCEEQDPIVLLLDNDSQGGGEMEDA